MVPLEASGSFESVDQGRVVGVLDHDLDRSCLASRYAGGVASYRDGVAGSTFLECDAVEFHGPAGSAGAHLDRAVSLDARNEVAWLQDGAVTTTTSGTP